MRETIWIIWAKRAALFAVIVGVAYGMAMQFPHKSGLTVARWAGKPGERFVTLDDVLVGSPTIFAATLLAEIALGSDAQSMDTSESRQFVSIRPAV